MKKTIIFMFILFGALSSCVETERKPEVMEYSEKIIIGKTAEVHDGSALSHGYTRYLIAFNDGHTERVRFGVYSCLQINDTVSFSKKPDSWFWEMEVDCK